MNRRLLTALSRAHVGLFRASGRRLGGRIRSGAPVLLVTTTGRKSGKQRTTPLLYLEDAGRYVVIASVGGAPKHPAWYLNLLADPAATIEVGRRKLAVSASTASPEERARLWPLAVQIYRGYEDYQAKTTREIPIVILSPALAEGGTRTHPARRKVSKRSASLSRSGRQARRLGTSIVWVWNVLSRSSIGPSSSSSSRFESCTV